MAIAQGRCLVGVNTSDNDFKTPEKTGGEKTHTLTVSEMPSHNHFGYDPSDGFALHCINHAWGDYVVLSKGVEGEVYNYQYPTMRGDDQPHNNMSPYYTCYIFKRTN